MDDKNFMVRRVSQILFSPYPGLDILFLNLFLLHLSVWIIWLSQIKDKKKHFIIKNIKKEKKKNKKRYREWTIIFLLLFLLPCLYEFKENMKFSTLTAPFLMRGPISELTFLIAIPC